MPASWLSPLSATAATERWHSAYVALAEALDSPLLTADVGLSKATGPRCVIEVLRSSG